MALIGLRALSANAAALSILPSSLACGSCTALRAAEAHKAAYVLGVEINEEFAKRADLRLWEARRKRSEESVLEELVGTL
jgi:hypothetical protein